MSSRFVRRLVSSFSWVGYILLILLLMALGEWLPLMPAVQRFQQAHPSTNQFLIYITIAMSVLGGLLLVSAQFLVRVPDPRTLARAAEESGAVKGKGWFFAGRTVSAGFSDEARFWQVRQAFRDGDWWRVPRWRRLSLMLLGGVLLFYGLFGLLFLLSPPGVKFILFLAVLYATIRTVYGFAVDRPDPLDGGVAG